jgi:hypothetical protein
VTFCCILDDCSSTRRPLWMCRDHITTRGIVRKDQVILADRTIAGGVVCSILLLINIVMLMLTTAVATFNYALRKTVRSGPTLTPCSILYNCYTRCGRSLFSLSANGADFHLSLTLFVMSLSCFLARKFSGG